VISNLIVLIERNTVIKSWKLKIKTTQVPSCVEGNSQGSEGDDAPAVGCV